MVSHELGLPGSLARALSARAGFGFSVDVIADPGMNTAGALAAMLSVAHHRYDAVIITVGVNDALALTPVPEWRAQLGTMLAGFTAALPATSPVFVVGIPQMDSIPLFNARVAVAAAAHARRLNQATLELSARDDRTMYLVLPPLAAHDNPERTMRYRTAGDYTYWAAGLAAQMHNRLADPPVDARERGAAVAVDERKRQQTVDVLARTADRRDFGLERITALANRAFRTQSALITVLGADLQWNLAQSGSYVGEVPRQLSICESTVEHGDVLVVRDTLEDARFRDNPLVVGGPRIRFYAGFPIEGPSGERIGSLCVVDTQPRRRHDDINESLLRELALMAQREIWRHLRDHGTAPPR